MAKRSRNPISIPVREIRKSLSAIERSLTRLLALTDGAGARVPANLGPQRRKLKLSSKRRAQLKLQGSYMGYLRQLAAAQKKRVRSLRERRGIVASIALARKLAAR